MKQLTQSQNNRPNHASIIDFFGVDAEYNEFHQQESLYQGFVDDKLSATGDFNANGRQQNLNFYLKSINPKQRTYPF